jgi:3-hydroxy-3-methylglutaryl CoA synthase
VSQHPADRLDLVWESFDAVQAFQAQQFLETPQQPQPSVLDAQPQRIQVGSAHRRALYSSLELDQTKDFSTLEFLGNTGSVALPITMAMGIEKAPPAKDEKIAILGIGSGLNCLMLGVQW